MKLCIHTIFWAFGEKTPSLLFMLREENLLYIARICKLLWWGISKLREIFSEAVLCCLSNEATRLLDLSCALTRFSLFQITLRRPMVYPLLVPDAACCMMLMLCKNDVMMLCYAKWYLCRKYTHPCIKIHNLFISALTFRCKPPLGASSPFTSAESAFIFRCKPPLGASSPFTFGGISVYFSL